MIKLKVLIHKLTPKYFLTCVAGFFARRNLGSITTLFIKLFSKKYKIDLNEAKLSNPSDYKTFNDFFVRELKDGQRPILAKENEQCMPVDGTMAEFGDIDNDTMISAKGCYYSLNDLLGGDTNCSSTFIDGKFACIYLAPSNYHRIHMPVTGKLTKMIFVPGKYYSVNPTYVQNIDKLFTKNERAICFFDTEKGPLAMVLVGATIVGSIATIWAGEVAPNKLKKVTVWEYTGDQQITIQKGEEMGRFYLGSTVITCWPKNTIEFTDSIKTGTPVKLGERLAIEK